MDSSSLSQILSGKRPASRKIAGRIMDKIGVSPQQRQVILNKLLVTGAVDSSANIGDARSPSFHQISIDAFVAISEWYHFAILELTFIDHFRNDAAWIARMLNISVTEVRAAIERLQRLELLEEVDGKLRKTEVFITNFDSGVTAPALKAFQRQVLQLALDAIDTIPQEEKDITSMTMTIDVAKLPQARQLITKFRRSLCQFLEEGPRTQVYNLGIQLYPVSKNTEEI